MIGYLTVLQDAEDYFKNERFESAAWDALTVNSAKDEKTACLTEAFNRLYNSERLILPLPADATADRLVNLIKAQCEMAYFIAQHGPDMDIRKGLQAQGVIDAGVVKESYDKDKLDEMPIPQYVMNLLVGYWEGTDVPIHVQDIDRDEDYHADKDIVSELDDLED